MKASCVVLFLSNSNSRKEGRTPHLGCDNQRGGAGDRTSNLPVTGHRSIFSTSWATQSLQDSLQQWTLESGPALVDTILWCRRTSCQPTNTLTVSRADTPPWNTTWLWEHHTPTAPPRLATLTALKRPRTFPRNYWTHACTHTHLQKHTQT